MIFLNIDTSDKKCSVALFVNGENIAHKQSEGYSHSEKLAGLVEDVLNKSNIKIQNLSAVGLCSGPGSYTGLRIGTAFTKGICYSANIPFIAISSLQILAYQAINTLEKKSSQKIISLIDARRDEVYLGAFDVQLNPLLTPTNHILTSESHKMLLAGNSNEIIVVGNACEKTKLFWKDKNIKYLDEIKLDALYMNELVANRYKNKQFESVAYFEPFYLKQFVPGPSKKIF